MGDRSTQGSGRYSELTMNKVAKAIVPGMTEADVLQLFNTTAFSWSPDIIDAANAHTMVRTLHHPLFHRIQESTEAILFVWTAVMSLNRERRRKSLFPQPRRERDSSSAVIYRNLLIIFKMI